MDAVIALPTGVYSPNVEKAATRKEVEYFPAFTKWGNACFVSLKRRRHCAKRNQAGRHATTGRTPYRFESQILSSTEIDDKETN